MKNIQNKKAITEFNTAESCLTRECLTGFTTSGGNLGSSIFDFHSNGNLFKGSYFADKYLIRFSITE